MAVVPHADIPLQRRLVQATGYALVLVTIASFGILVSRTLEMNGGAWPALFHDMRLALTVTHYGRVWVWRVPALAILWLTWWWARRRPGSTWAAWIMALTLAAIVMTRSDTGHPADHGDFTLAVWIDWLHVLSAGAWVGSLFGMSLVVFPRLLHRRDGIVVQTAAIFQRLSTLSGVALAVLLACGIYTAVQQLGHVAALWTSRYGVTLDVKVAIVLAMILIGAHNRYIKLPRLLHHASHPSEGQLTSQAASGDIHHCARAVLAESLLGLAVIAAAACLIHAMPPADMRTMHAWSTGTAMTLGSPCRHLA